MKALGSPGLIQEFPAKAGGTLALIDPDPLGANITLQMYADLYAYYATLSQTSVGYPTIDTTACPANQVGTCNYQNFTVSTALFVYSSPSKLNVSVVNPYYTEWTANGGLGGALGVPASAPGSVTSVAATAGAQQLFAGGAIFTYPASSTTPFTYTVSGSIYSAWVSAGGYATTGFPTSEAVLQTSGVYLQSFERGHIQWTPGTTPNVLFPLSAISISGAAQGLNLSPGATATLTANLYDTQGSIATGRVVTWSTSNGNVVTVQGNGATATIKAVGAGVAKIYVTGEGITSPAFPVTVNGVCCAIGQGAPTQAITQAFQTAATRNQLAVALPNPSPVTRSGNGYVQTLAASGSSAVYVIAEADNSPIAYVIGGGLYAAYVAAGGFAGSLGYPASDATPGGTQAFASGAALAGTPVHLVPPPIAGKWLQLGAETGSLGAVTSDAAAFVSLSGAQGSSQAFANGTIFGIASGSRSGQAYFSSGLILARYLALAGPAGTLGTPVQDLTANSAGVQIQNFETGYIDLQPGAAAAVEHYNPRTPAVGVAPPAAVPGGRVHISLTGFAFGATLTVSITGQPNFTVSTPGGVFSWDAVIAAGAKPATVTVQAKASGSSDAASGSYSITSLTQLQPKMAIVSGNQQTGLPGSTLAAPLIAVLTDINGNPLPGVPVGVNVSPGATAQVSPVTDANGQISAALRLPPTGGVALLAVSAAGQVASFSALSASTTIQGVPAFSQTTPQGARVAALAALIRYYQNAGVLGAPNGLATAAGLAAYLASNNGTAASDTGAAIANPWAATQFAGLAGGISVENASLNSILDWLESGSPLVVELNLTVDGTAAGSTSVIAIGSNPDGSVAILDPDPGFGRLSLADYLSGFTASGHTIQGTLAAVIRIAASRLTPSGFVVASPIAANASASSASGACNALDLGDPAVPGQPAPARVGGVRFLACDGTAPPYQISFANPAGATVYVLAGGPAIPIPAAGGPAWQVTRNGSALAVTAQTLSISAIVNAATFGPGVSPGGIFTIFGSGLSAGSSPPAVTAGNLPVTILAAFPFQINAWMPPAVGAGSAAIQVTGPLGTTSQNVNVATTAPGIFVIGTTPDGRPLGAILNQDGSVNNANAPVSRGQYISIYGTGLGATTAQQGLQVATSDVEVVLDGGPPLVPSFKGLTPGIAGLYQVNFQVPAGTPPGVYHNVAIQAAGQTSNVVALAVQ